MDKRGPNYWRAFWITAALVGMRNVAFTVYYQNCPEEPIGKGGRPMRVVSDWAMPIVAIDLPGVVLTLPFWFGSIGDVSVMSATFIAGQVISTVFWGFVAIALERWRFGGRTPTFNLAAANPDALPDPK
jgi:hypothetical protein